MIRLKKGVFVLSMGVLCVSGSGCGILNRAQMYDQLSAEAEYLRSQVARLKEQQEESQSELEKTRQALEKALAKEISQSQATLSVTDRGLIISFQSEVFFDSGKAEVSASGEESLDRVIGVIQEESRKAAIAVEGHTDNQPIRYSGWRSNWDLSAARALAVLHYILSSSNMDPQHFSVAGYGEFRSRAANETPEGRQQNRRVEIVIFPESK